MTQPIRQGVFTEPMGAYRAADGISSSALKWFRRSPAHYKAFRDGRIANEPSEAQAIGTLLHSLILEGRKDYVIHPATYPGNTGEKPWNWNATFCREWAAEQSREVVSESQADQIELMAEAVRFHPLAGSLLTGGKPEASIYARDIKTGLQLKGRADYATDRYIVDVKKAVDGGTVGFCRSLAKYDYEYQAAMYVTIAELNGMDVSDFYWIALELEPVPMVNVLLLSAADLEHAKAAIRKNLNELAKCHEKDEWPGYCGASPNMARLPAWKYNDEATELEMDK